MNKQQRAIAEIREPVRCARVTVYNDGTMDLDALGHSMNWQGPEQLTNNGSTEPGHDIRCAFDDEAVAIRAALEAMPPGEWVWIDTPSQPTHGFFARGEPPDRRYIQIFHGPSCPEPTLGTHAVRLYSHRLHKSPLYAAADGGKE